MRHLQRQDRLAPAWADPSILTEEVYRVYIEPVARVEPFLISHFKLLGLSQVWAAARSRPARAGATS